MSLPQQLAKHIRELHFGGNWTDRSLRDALMDITWQEANMRIGSLHTIAAITYHTNYYVHVTIPVLQGANLEAHDRYSFDHPDVTGPSDWQRMLEKMWHDGELFAKLIEDLPESRLEETFVDPKYGTYFDNLQGIIEHSYYHIGQIMIIKKLIREGFA